MQTGVHASDDGADVACPVSLIEWFLNFYKDTQQGPFQPLEGICRAGEVLFVPRGWWHMALNLEVNFLPLHDWECHRTCVACIACPLADAQEPFAFVLFISMGGACLSTCVTA